MFPFIHVAEMLLAASGDVTRACKNLQLQSKHTTLQTTTPEELHQMTDRMSEDSRKMEHCNVVETGDNILVLARDGILVRARVSSAVLIYHSTVFKGILAPDPFRRQRHAQRRVAARDRPAC